MFTLKPDNGIKLYGWVLKGRTIRLIVSDSKLNLKKNFGTIIFYKGYKQLKVKLIDPISIGNIISDIIELTLSKENDSFNALENLYALNCICYLVEDGNSVCIGEVTISFD